MEHNDFSDEFESFLQEKANEHKLYPSDKVWSAIQQKINRPKRWPFVALTLLFVGLGLITSIIEPANNQLALRSPELVQKLNATTLKNLSVSQIKNPISVSSNYLNKNNYSKFNHSSSLTTNINSISPSNEVDNNSLVSNPQEITIQEATIFDTTSKTSIDLSISALIVDENLTERNIENKNTELGNIKLTPISTVQKEENITQEHQLPEILSPSVLKNSQHKKNPLNWQVYFSPTVSYRTLSGSGTVPVNFIAQSLTSGTTNFTNVNDVVNHKAALGMELGAGLVYQLSKKIRLKTGLQFNYNQYDIRAYNSTPELAPLSASRSGNVEINAISKHRSKNGYSQTWLKNLHAMISVPIGAELTILGNQNISLNIGGSLQPTYILRHDAYMLSTNLNNYAKENSLNRNFNINSSAEVFITVQKAGLKWTFGPQIRYQLLSSYKKEYPIIEHLKDYGFKIGLSKTIK